MTLLFFICSIAFAYEADIANSHASLWYAHAQLRAAMNDMYLVLGWFPEEKEMMKEVSEAVIKNLDEVSSFLINAKIADEFKRYQDDMLKMVAMVKDMYKDIDVKDPEEYNEQFDAFAVLSNESTEDFDKYEQDTLISDMPEETVDDPILFESNMAETEEDAASYREAHRLMEEKQFNEAYVILDTLFKEETNQPFHDAVAVALTDCINRCDSVIEGCEELNTMDLSLYLLEDIINRKEYSPLLYKAFYRWRTLEQYFNHGTSNMSEIPNKMYNEKRWELMQIIHNHLIEHPDDTWAWTQRILFMMLPNIERGEAFGNSNLLHWAYLYTDIFEEDETQGEGDADGPVAEEVIADEAAEE